MRASISAAAAACLALCGAARAAPVDVDFSGQARATALHREASPAGPLALARALDPRTAEPAAPRTSLTSLEAELKARLGPVSAAVFVQRQHGPGAPTAQRAAVHELQISGEAFGWQLSAGRKHVGWDVGYAFRPNDLVAREERRTLLSALPRGRPLVQAEYFADADTAWSVVAVNPTAERDARFGDERALALRAYRRDGAADWHGFARWGQRTGASVGAALAWVASDSLEVHGSARWLRRADGWRGDALPPGALLAASPWHVESGGPRGQILLGLSWTGASRLSVLAEAWWDGTAPGARQWRGWAARNAALAALSGHAPPAAVAGNLASQTQAFASQSLRRGNVFVRASWEHGGWAPSIDLLATPEDRGLIVTAALAWTGDRWRVDAGLRRHGGAAGSVTAQLPQRRQAYAALGSAF